MVKLKLRRQSFIHSDIILFIFKLGIMRKKIYFSTIFIFFVCLRSVFPLPAFSESIEDKQRVDLLVHQSIDMLRENNYVAAEALLKEACALDQSHDGLHIQHGLVLNQLGRNDEAIQEFLTAIKLNRNGKEAWLRLITAYIDKGDVQAALAAAKESLPYMPANNQIVIKKLIEDLAGEIEDSGAKDGADYFASATRHHKALWNNSKMPLRVYIDNGATVPGVEPQYQEIICQAFSDWRNAASGKVSFIFISAKSGADIVVHWSNDRSNISSSIEGGNTVLDVDALSSITSIRSAKITLVPPAIATGTGNLEIRLAALHEIGHALGLDGHSPNPADVMYAFAGSIKTIPQLSERDRNTLQKLYSLDINQSNRVRVLTEQSRADCMQGNFAGAAQKLKEACEIDPSSYTLHSLCGLVLSRLRRDDEAKEHLLKAVQLNKNDPTAWRSLGAFYSSIGNLPEAKNAFQECLRLDPSDIKVKQVLEGLEKRIH